MPYCDGAHLGRLSPRALPCCDGFTDTQVSKFYISTQYMFSLNVDKAKAKLDFLHSYGFTFDDLCQLLVDDGHVIRSRLEKCIIQSCEILKGLLKDHKNSPLS